MVDQGFVLTRSRSDNQIKKSLVWSPTPIKEISVSFLDNLNGFSDNFNGFSNAKELNFDGPENPLSIRKFQSAGLLGINFDRLNESPEARTVERNLFETHFDEKIFSSSSYSTSEIPVRASNPITRDAKFRESEDEDTNSYLKSNFNALEASLLEQFSLAQN